MFEFLIARFGHVSYAILRHVVAHLSRSSFEIIYVPLLRMFSSPKDNRDQIDTPARAINYSSTRVNYSSPLHTRTRAFGEREKSALLTARLIDQTFR